MSDGLFIIGDSHGAVLAMAAEVAGLRVGGGAMATSSDFFLGRVSFESDGELRITGMDDDYINSRCVFFRRGLDAFGVENLRQLAGMGVPLVSMVGFHLHNQIGRIGRLFTLEPSGKGRQFITGPAFERAILGPRAKLFDDLSFLIELGFSVTAVGAPPRNQHRAMFDRAEDLVAAEMTRRGARVHLPRTWSAGADGFLRPEYCSENPNDRSHANLAYGRALLAQLAREMPLHAPNSSLPAL